MFYTFPTKASWMSYNKLNLIYLRVILRWTNGVATNIIVDIILVIAINPLVTSYTHDTATFLQPPILLLTDSSGPNMS